MKIGDGAVRVFINTKGKNKGNFSEEFQDFMEYVTDSSAEIADRTKSEKIKLIHRQVEKIKKSEKMGVKYMLRWEELAEARDEGIAEGRNEGLVEGRSEGEERKLIKLICKKLSKGKTIEQIAEDLEEDTEEIERICGAAQKFAPGYDCDKIYERLHEK